MKALTGFGLSLRVMWSPCNDSSLSGEVKDEVILVYEMDLADALDTLHHEFVDYAVSMAVKPYEKVTAFYAAMINSLMVKLSEDAYQEKEKAIEALLRLFPRLR